MADLSLQLNEPAAAAAWARRALDQEPAAAAYATLATAELRLRHTAAARDAVERGLKLNARHPGLLALRRQLR